MKHMYFQYYSTENNPHFYYQYHSVESNPHCIYIYISTYTVYIHVYGTFTANGNIFVRPSSSVHSATPWGYRVSFDLTVPGRKARSEAYELRWETSPPVWWDKEKRACRCEISLKWKLVNCWVDNSWVFWFVLVFLSKLRADNVVRNERNRRGFDGFLSIFIFFFQDNFLKCHSAFVSY